MNTRILVAVVVAWLCAPALAIDATPAAENAPSTDSKLWAVDSAMQALTSRDVLKRCAQAYGKAKTYYEEARLSLSADTPNGHSEDRIKATIAFKRPSTLRADLTGGTSAVLYFEADTAVYYKPGTNEYAKKTGRPFATFVAEMNDLDLELTPAGADFYASATQDALDIGGLKPVVFEGQWTLEVGVTRSEGKTSSYFFDPCTFYLVGTRTTVPLGDNGRDGAITYTRTIDRVLIDKLPKDASGKDSDIFSFTLPKDAKPVKGPAETKSSATPETNPKR